MTGLVLFLELSDDRPNAQREKCSLIFPCQCDRWIKQTSGADIKRGCTVAIKKTNLSSLSLSMYSDEQARSARCLSSYCLADDRYLPVLHTLAHGSTPTDARARFHMNKIGNNRKRKENQCVQAGDEEKIFDTSQHVGTTTSRTPKTGELPAY